MENKGENTDLEALKAQWKHDFQQTIMTPNDFSHQQILQIMKQQTSSSLKRIQRNLCIEIAVTIPFFPMLYIVLERSGRQLPLIFWLGLIMITFGYHVYLYLKLRKSEPLADNNLLDTLKQQTKEIGKFMKMYDLMAWILSLILFLAMAFFFYASRNNTLICIVGLPMSILTGIGSMVSIKWYVQKLYGQHYSNLLASQETLAG